MYSVSARCSRLKVAEMDFSAKCAEIADRTEGLSGREISKLGVAWQVCDSYGKYNDNVIVILPIWWLRDELRLTLGFHKLN